MQNIYIRKGDSMSIINEIKNNHPYFAEFVYEFKTRLRVLCYKTKSLKRIRKRLARMYKKRMGFELNYDNPKRYTELIQCRKVCKETDKFSELSDKYLVREFVRSKIGDQYLIPLLGCWESVDEIDFSTLPNEFVIKTNNASGTNIIVRSKDNIDIKLLRKKLSFWLKTEFWFAVGYEMHYQNIPPRIIAEKLIKSESEDLQDYKFLCFHGEIKYIWVDTGRYHNHKRTIFDINWVKQDWKQHTYESEKYIPKPLNFDKMKEIVKILSAGFDHVRVDLYNTNGVIYFGEMTFTNAGGFEKYYPDTMDYELGNYWNS